MAFRVLTAFLLVVSACARANAKGDRLIKTPSGEVKATRVASDLDHPWGVAFLPDGRMLVTERPGRMRVIDAAGKKSEPLKGVPKAEADGQGGLLDVALSPAFKSDRLVYISYAEPGDGGSCTAVARGKLSAKEDALENVTVIFRQTPRADGGLHFGSRLAFARDGKLFVTMGERFKFDPAQDLTTTMGKIVCIEADGGIPKDNPFVGRKDAKPEIWSYGHRNVQGAAVNPTTGVLWAHEYGPKGGDELNIVKPGKNYGWPLVSWGNHYDDKPIAKPPTRPDLEQPVRYWDKVISPSGMTFYTGDMFPKWKGSVLIGGLSAAAVVRVILEGDKAVGEERIDIGERVRDVAQAPDGSVIVLTDTSDGEVIRLTQ